MRSGRAYGRAQKTTRRGEIGIDGVDGLEILDVLGDNEEEYGGRGREKNGKREKNEKAKR